MKPTRKPYPTMAVSPPAEIAAWNKGVSDKKKAQKARQLAKRQKVKQILAEVQS